MKHTNRFLVFAILAGLLVSISHSAPDEDDCIIIHGKQFGIRPLTPPPAVVALRPAWIGRLNAVGSSWPLANDRGYTAVWEVDDDRLYLRAIAVQTDKQVLTLADVFHTTSNRVVALWYDGVISVPVREPGTQAGQDTRLASSHHLRYTVARGLVKSAEVVQFSVSEHEVGPITTQVVAKAVQHLPVGIDIPTYGNRYPESLAETATDLNAIPFHRWHPVQRAIWNQLRGPEQESGHVRK